MYRKQFKVKKDFIKINRLVLLILLTIYFSIPLYSQVGIGTYYPEESSILDLHSEDKALLLSRVESSDKIKHPEDGMMVYSKFANCIQVYNMDKWESISKCNYLTGDLENISEDSWFGLYQLDQEHQVGSKTVRIEVGGNYTANAFEFEGCGLHIKVNQNAVGFSPSGNFIIKLSVPVTNFKFRVLKLSKDGKFEIKSNKGEPQLTLFGESTCLANAKVTKNTISNVSSTEEVSFEVNVGGEPFTELVLKNLNPEANASIIFSVEGLYIAGS